jgi:hypothetical protein
MKTSIFLGNFVMTLLGSWIGMMMMMMSSRHSSAFAVCHEGWATVGALGDNWVFRFLKKGRFQWTV